MCKIHAQEQCVDTTRIYVASVWKAEKRGEKSVLLLQTRLCFHLSLMNRNDGFHVSFSPFRLSSPTEFFMPFPINVREKLVLSSDLQYIHNCPACCCYYHEWSVLAIYPLSSTQSSEEKSGDLVVNYVRPIHVYLANA